MKIKELIGKLNSGSSSGPYLVAGFNEKLTDEEARELGKAIENLKSDQFSLLGTDFKTPFTSEFMCVVFKALKENKSIKKITFGVNLKEAGVTDARWIIDDNATEALCNLIKENKNITEINLNLMSIDTLNAEKLIDEIRKNKHLVEFDFKYIQTTKRLPFIHSDYDFKQKINFLLHRNKISSTLVEEVTKKLETAEKETKEENNQRLENLYAGILSLIKSFRKENKVLSSFPLETVIDLNQFSPREIEFFYKKICDKLEAKVYYSMAKKYVQVEMVEEAISSLYHACILPEARLELANILMIHYSKLQPFFDTRDADYKFILILLAQVKESTDTISANTLRDKAYSFLGDPSKTLQTAQYEKKESKKVLTVGEFSRVVIAAYEEMRKQPSIVTDKEYVIIRWARELLYNITEGGFYNKERLLDKFLKEYGEDTQRNSFPTIAEIAQIKCVSDELKQRYDTNDIAIFEDQFLSTVNKDKQESNKDRDIFDIRFNYYKIKKQYYISFENKAKTFEVITENKEEQEIVEEPAAALKIGKEEIPENKVEKIKNILLDISNKNESLISKKKEALKIIKGLVPSINDVEELKELLLWLKKEASEKGAVSFIKKERHYPFFRTRPYGNTKTWYDIVGHIKAKAFKIAQQKQNITEDEDKAFLTIFDEHRGRINIGPTIYHNAYKSLK